MPNLILINILNNKKKLNITNPKETAIKYLICLIIIFIRLDIQISLMNKLKVNLDKFVEDYKLQLTETVLKLDHFKLQKIIKLFELTIKNKKKIFTCGNGGSASVSNHFLCDFNKGIKFFSNKKIKPKVISLSNSIENITAISNDESFDNIFENQLENYVESGDLLCVFSCSGNSKNILKVLRYAKKRKCKTVAFTGFHKKKIKNADIHLDLDIKNYGISEDVFQSIMHITSQFLKIKYTKNKLKAIL